MLFFSCEIVDYAIGLCMTKELCIAVLQIAIILKKPPAGSIHLSDRGSQYCSKLTRAAKKERASRVYEP